MKAHFTDFDFDTTTGELHRRGEIVRLQSQPAQVLAMLVEHAGEVVTRDVLREKIWGADTFVDFDKGLNFAIAQVRTALGDSADKPVFVRTLPKRGYQFIAPIAGRRPVQRHWWPWALAAAVLIAVAVAGAEWIRHTPQRAPDPAHTIAVVPFDNETGIGDFDRYAANLTDSVVAELTVGSKDRFGVIGNASALRVRSATWRRSPAPSTPATSSLARSSATSITFACSRT